MTVAAPPAASWEGTGVSVAEVLRNLAQLRDTATEGAAHGRAMLLNLVAWGATPQVEEGASELLERIVGPSRVVVVTPADEAGISARADVFIRPSPIAGAVTCEELVRLRVGPDIAPHAGSVVTPLVRGDLPTVLWWPCAPLPGEASYRELVGISDRVVTEASASGPEAVATLAEEVVERSAAFTDLAWAAITPWRQLVAQMVRGETAARLREGPSRLIVVHEGDEPTLQALLLAGWLRASLGDALAVDLGPAPLGAGHVASLTVEGPGGRRLRAERVPDSPSCTVSVSRESGERRRRRMPLRVLTRTDLLSGELELGGRDATFERAVAAAARLAHGRS